MGNKIPDKFIMHLPRCERTLGDLKYDHKTERGKIWDYDPAKRSL